jgi:hypothetical protein
MIRTFLVLEWAVLLIGAAIIVTQILVPAIRGRPLFPILRKRALKAEVKLAQARDRDDVAQLDQAASKLNHTKKEI